MKFQNAGVPVRRAPCKNMAGLGLIPVKFFVLLFGRRGLGKVVVGHQFFNLVKRFMKGFDEFFKIFFVQKDFMLFKNKSTVLGKPFFTFRNGEVKVLRTSRFQIKKVGSFAGPHPFCKDFAPVVSFFHFQKNLCQ